ncbi:MAG TPA: helix-turn-helix transcriptional regulator [Solirubrobacteraceae bacterium]|nr:helix-turn-helix transcriptional regulator [Solirubrobacteraceae bacterium]
MPEQNVRALATAIRKARVEAGYTQEAFAARIDLDRSYYGSIERGERNIGVEALATIATGLGTTAWQLLRKAGI